MSTDNHLFWYELDGYRLTRLPSPGGYSGYLPKRRQSAVTTLSSTVLLAWGVVEEDTIITLAGNATTQREYLSIYDRYQAEDANGLPRGYRFHAPDADLTVEMVDVQGSPLHHIYQGVGIEMRVLSEGPTRLYFCESEAADGPGAKAASNADGGHGPETRTTNKRLQRNRNTNAASYTGLTATCTDCQGSDLLGIFVSDRLRGQTFAAGGRLKAGLRFDAVTTGLSGGGEYENVPLLLYPYIWRSGTGRVATVFGETTELAAYADPSPCILSPYGPTWQEIELPALSDDITVSAGDRFVCEVWLSRVELNTANGTVTIDGERDDWSEGDSAPAAASFVEWSGNILWEADD